MKIKIQKRTYKNYIIPILIAILIGLIGVIATNYISENRVSSPTGNFTNLIINDNGNTSVTNISGIYINNNKAYSRTADVVICDNSSSNNLFKCDFICNKGTDCSTILQNCNGKNCFINDGTYIINDYLNYSMNSILTGNDNTTLSFTNDHGGELAGDYNQGIISWDGIKVSNINFINNVTFNNDGHYVGYIFVYPSVNPSEIKNNYFIGGLGINVRSKYRNIASSDYRYNLSYDQNLLIENNNFLNNVVAMSITQSNNVVFKHNNINASGISSDSIISILTCGSNNEISYNDIYKPYQTGYAIELNPDATRSCVEYNNKILFNNIQGGVPGSENRGLIKLAVGGNTHKTQILNNVIHDSNASGIESYGVDDVISGNQIYNLTGNGIKVYSLLVNQNNMVISDNVITNVGSANVVYSGIEVQAYNSNISNLKVTGNILDGSPNGLYLNFANYMLNMTNLNIYGNIINGTNYCIRNGSISTNATINIATSNIYNNICTGSKIKIESISHNISTLGSLGVGTNTPAEVLDVLNGNIYARSSYPGTGATPISRKIYFETISSSGLRVASAGMSVRYFRWADTDFGSFLDFYTSSDNNPVLAMTIDKNSDVNITTGNLRINTSAKFCMDSGACSHYLIYNGTCIKAVGTGQVGGCI